MVKWEPVLVHRLSEKGAKTLIDTAEIFVLIDYETCCAVEVGAMSAIL